MEHAREKTAMETKEKSLLLNQKMTRVAKSQLNKDLLVGVGSRLPVLGGVLGLSLAGGWS